MCMVPKRVAKAIAAMLMLSALGLHGKSATLSAAAVRLNVKASGKEKHDREGTFMVWAVVGVGALAFAGEMANLRSIEAAHMTCPVGGVVMPEVFDFPTATTRDGARQNFVSDGSGMSGRGGLFDPKVFMEDMRNNRPTPTAPDWNGGWARLRGLSQAVVQALGGGAREDQLPTFRMSVAGQRLTVTGDGLLEVDGDMLHMRAEEGDGSARSASPSDNVAFRVHPGHRHGAAAAGSRAAAAVEWALRWDLRPGETLSGPVRIEVLRRACDDEKLSSAGYLTMTQHGAFPGHTRGSQVVRVITEVNDGRWRGRATSSAGDAGLFFIKGLSAEEGYCSQFAVVPVSGASAAARARAPQPLTVQEPKPYHEPCHSTSGPRSLCVSKTTPADPKKVRPVHQPASWNLVVDGRGHEVPSTFPYFTFEQFQF